MGVSHRDLKPENLLLDQYKNIKIIDFGLSNTYKKSQLLKTACGSPCYAAPEMIAGQEYQGLRVDIWSCGVILFALVCGYLPFEDPDTTNLYKKIIRGDFQIPKFVSKDAADLIKCILNTSPEKRFTIEDIRNHKWFDLLGKSELRILKSQKIIGINIIPVNKKVLDLLEHKYQYDRS